MERSTVADGRYRLERELGAGGMATVWQAWDERLRAWRAIKRLRPEVASNASARQRFEQEARAMARLQHAHLLAVHDVGSDDGTPFLVMELAPGGSLAELVARDGPLAPALACRLAEEVLGALQHAHDAGVVHRDVKPHNVLLSADGRALVSDFGIARILDEESGLTRTGSSMGTLAYMAPEQRASAARVDGKADVYAAAGTLYHLLTGREPLDLYMEREAASTGLPEALAELLARAVRYAPEERPTAGELASALRELRPSLGPEPALPRVATPAPAARSEETWSSTVDVGVSTLGEPVVVERPPPPRAPARGLAFALVATAAATAAAVALWSRLAAAPLDRWDTEGPFPAPDVSVGGPDGRLAWIEEGTIRVGRPGAYEVLGPVDADSDLDWDDAGRLWVLRPEQARGIVATVVNVGEERRFALPFRGPDSERTLSGDAARLAEFDPAGIRWAEAGGAPAATLTSSAALFADWSPDGRRMVAILAEEDPTLVVLDTRDGARRDLRVGETLIGPGVGVAWLPDGRVAWLERVGNDLGVWAADPDVEPLAPTWLADVSDATVALSGTGPRLYAAAIPTRTVLEVADAATFTSRATREVGEETWIAGWVDDARVQLHEHGEFRIWDPRDDSVVAGLEWQRERPPELAWKPDEIACEAGRCLASEDDRGALKFTPVDPRTGEAGEPFVTSLPAAGKPTWNLSPTGEIAVATPEGVWIVSADGRSTQALGGFDLRQVLSAEWAPDGGLWIVGTLERGMRIEHWTPTSRRTLREGRRILAPPYVSPDGRSVALRTIEIGDQQIVVLTGS